MPKIRLLFHIYRSKGFLGQRKLWSVEERSFSQQVKLTQAIQEVMPGAKPREIAIAGTRLRPDEWGQSLGSLALGQGVEISVTLED